MLHELLVTLMGNPGDIFLQRNQFKIHDGFPLLHPGEKSSLERLAHLGYLYQQIQTFLDMDTPGMHRSVLATSLDNYLNFYRTDICDLEIQCMEPHSTVGIVQLKLEKVDLH
jgi:gamma-tubulin complex component 4